MKIGVNTRLLLPGTLEGIGRFTHEILSRMVKDHPEDEFFFFFDRPYDHRYVYGPNVTPIVIKPRARTPIHWFWWFEKALPKAFRKYKIEVFFSPELYTSLAVEIPCLMVAHDIAYHHFPEHFRWYQLWYLKKFTTYFLEKADKVSCVSYATMQDLIGVFSISKEKLFVTENGPTPEFYPIDSSKKQEVRNTITDGSPFFVYLGSIHPRKNIIQLIKAYELFMRNNVNSFYKLVLIGRMAWKTEKVEQAVAASPNKKDIIFLGQRKDAAQILASAEAMVYISLLEGFGIPILEAFSTDIPVITSNRGAMKEVAGNAALLVDPENFEEIAGAMQKVVSDSAFAKQMVEKGKVQLKKYDWSKSAHKIYNALKTLVN